MDFGSEYVYHYDLSDEESVSSSGSDSDTDHSPATNSSSSRRHRSAGPRRGGTGPQQTPKRQSLTQRLWNSVTSPFGGGSSNANVQQAPQLQQQAVVPPPPPLPPSASTSKPRREKRNVKCRKSDTNVVIIKFDQLKAAANMHAGEPLSCSNCPALLSAISKVDASVWCCDFCGHRNDVDVDQTAVPADADVTYLLEPAPEAAEATAADGDAAADEKVDLKDETLVVFCVDISGSMSSFAGNIRRLEGVKIGILEQLKELKLRQPNRKVAIVTFEQAVSYHGDGSQAAVSLNRTHLDDEAATTQFADTLAEPGRVAATHDALHAKVSALRTAGSTALGPALLMSVQLAGRKSGSQVIICTDGEANVGMGSLSRGDEASRFYDRVGQLAAQKGVSVSVLTIQDTSCRLTELGKVADVTNGHVNVMDPANLKDEFGLILSNPVIATHVQLTFLLHANLYVRQDDKKDVLAKKDVGNVTASTEVTFEFGVRTQPQPPAAAAPPPAADAEPAAEAAGGAEAMETSPPPAPPAPPAPPVPEELPFQVQITYCDRQGAKALRVLTKTKKVTRSREEAEKKMDMKVIGVHDLQSNAFKAKKGVAFKYGAKARKKQFQRQVQQAPQMQEMCDMYEDAMAPVMAVKKQSYDRWNDDQYNACYQASKWKSSNFATKKK